MVFRLPWARIGLGTLFAFAAAATVHARIIDIRVNQAKGVDANVDYASLAEIGPWDDRNYALTAADIRVLSPNERDSHDPTPAFYRVWARKHAVLEGHPLPTRGPDQYPRSAVNTFLQRFEGIEIDGRIYRGINRIEGNTFEVFDEEELEEMNEDWPKFFTGEVKITTPQGAEESAVAVNPVDTNYVIAGSNGPGSGQKMWRSTDGGQTWSGAISLPGNTCCDATVGWSTDGQIAYTSSLMNCGGSGCGVDFFRSLDKGLTWSKSGSLSTSGSDKEYLHVDSYPGSPYKDNVYVAWHVSNVQKFARSTDKGATFGATQTLDSAFKGIGSDITSDKQGNVYYLFPSTGGSQIRVVKSSDGGTSFPAGSKVADTQASFDFPLPSMSTRNAFIYVAADTDLSNGPYGNSIYVAWSDTYGPESTTAANNHARVQVGYSRDGGATWSVTNPHPTSDGQSVDRYQSWLKVDAVGRVHVMYYDTRHSTGRTGIDVYYSVSLDGAQTWQTPRRLTTVTSPKINTSMEWGDYNGMDMAMNDIIAIYTDNRAVNNGDVWGVSGFADPAGPDYGIGVPSSPQLVCAGNPLPQIPVAMTALAGYTGSVTLSLPGLNPAVFTAGTFMPNPIAPASPSANSVLTIGTQAAAPAGTYSILVRGTDNQPTPLIHDAAFTVKVAAGTTQVPALASPADGASGVARQPVLSWAADSAATGYTIEIASDAAFASIVESGSSGTASYMPSAPLAPLTTYYWRVRATSPCGDSALSAVRSFTTGVTFPEPYCPVSFPSAVEPITRVVIGGINNPSSAAVGGSPALEDFTAISTVLTAGQSASIALEGNTAGSTYTNYFSVFVDWNHNGTFDTNERYDTGSIKGSTGTDGKQVLGTIAVPPGALGGATRMRVVKKYASSATYPDACNTSGYGQAEDYTVTVNVGPTYTVGGAVSGLAGSGLTLKLNGGAPLAINANGSFVFPNSLPAGASYTVGVDAQPANPVQACTVADGNGTIGSINVTNVAVTCTTTPTHTVGGTVSGLVGSGLVLGLNGSSLPVGSDGAFTFPHGVASGAGYAVTVLTQPSSPVQSCAVANGSGTMGAADVTNVAVTCVALPTYTVGGTVSGLSGSGLALKLNAGAALAIATDGAFAFPDRLTSGTAYAVTVSTQPSGQTCSVSNGSGTIGSADITNLLVTCAAIPPQMYTVGGRVTGVLSAGLVLQLNGANDLPMSANGLFAFTAGLSTGALYAVTVASSPSSPAQNCTVSNGNGTIGSANVTDVLVTCAKPITDRIFADGFEMPVPPRPAN